MLKTSVTRSRKIKVEKAYSPRKSAETVVPKIRLEGKWLERAGFSADSRVSVEVSDGTLVIRVEERP